MEHDNQKPPLWRTPMGLALISLVVVVAFYLINEHWAHVLGVWPYLVLVLCPLLHLFGHGGPGKGGEHVH
ncbi:MAG TPA: DUF2933 domain-containing protein [Burkholderiales bacterium]|nr:DUF2933 domain-containing protein [Burkholderiales bacterium]